ncbi:hypothetical protein Tco_1287747, partial [Tanacetum coccineum]
MNKSNANAASTVNKMNKSNANAASMVNKMNKSNANAANTVNNVTMKNSFGALTDDEEMGSKSNTIIFKPYQISDHSPSILSIPLSVKSKPKPFKFYNIITKHERFLNIVKDSWCNN